MALDLAAGFARLRSIAREDGEWEPIEPDAAIDLSYHVHFEPEVAGLPELAASFDNIGQEDLDLTKPLWRLHCIPCSDSQGYAAIVVRVHHCIGDGVHLSKLLMHLAVKEDGSPVDTNAAQHKFEAMINGGGGACRALRKVGKAFASPGAFASNGAASMKPLEAKTVWQRPAEDRRRGRFNGKRCVVLIPPHSLDFVKQCKNKAGVSVNDVLMGVTSGAIRRYCESQQDPLFTPAARSKAKFRALVPVAMPKAFPVGHDEADMLTNHWSFCSAKIPVREATPLNRLKATSREMGKLKTSMKPVVGLWMVNKLTPHLSTTMQQKTAKDLFAKHSLVFSNIPGPQEALYVGGERLQGCQIIYYNVIPQTIIVSMSGQVWMNITVDPDIVADRDCFVKCYFQELEELGRELGVSASVFTEHDTTIDVASGAGPSTGSDDSFGNEWNEEF